MGIAAQTTFLFVANLVFQIAAVSLLPMTQGFTKPIPAMFCMAVLTASMWCMARMIAGGIGVGFLFPLVAAAVPLAAVFVGFFVFGETARRRESRCSSPRASSSAWRAGFDLWSKHLRPSYRTRPATRPNICSEENDDPLDERHQR